MPRIWLLACLFALAAQTQARAERATGALVAGAGEAGKQSRFNASIAYSVATDLAEQEKPRAHEHDVTGDVGYALGKGYSIFGIADLYYTSLGRAVLTQDSGNPIYWDFTAGATKSFDLGRALGASNSVKASLKNALPVSESNRYEGINSIPGASVGLRSMFFGNATALTNTLSYNYVVNTYKFSPVSGAINTRDSLAYAFDGTVRIVGDFSASVGFGVKYSRKLDGSNNYCYNNVQSLAYELGKFSFAVSHENGGFTRDGDLSLWYVDRYRNLVFGSATYGF